MVQNLPQRKRRLLECFSVVPLTDDGSAYLRELTSRLKGDKARYDLLDSTADVVFSVERREPMWEIRGISWEVILTLFMWGITRHFSDECLDSADFHRMGRFNPKGGEVSLARQLLKELPASAWDIEKLKAKNVCVYSLLMRCHSDSR